MLRLEVCKFIHIMQRALTCASICDVALQKFKLPYKVWVLTMALRSIHISNVLLALIFGENFRKNILKGELISLRSRSSQFPVYIHLFLLDRIREVLHLENVIFLCYHDFKKTYTYNFSSLAIIGIVGSNRTFHSYGWSKDRNYIRWKYNN